MKWFKSLSPKDRFRLPANLQDFDLKVVRGYSSSDYERCQSIYLGNEGSQIPNGNRGEFERFLKDDGILKLVIEVDGRVEGIGGIYVHSKDPNCAWLAFGIIDANKQGRGLGTKLLLSRLALLPEPDAYWQVFLQGLDASARFYCGFGFEYFGSASLDGGSPNLDLYYTVLKRTAVRSLRAEFLDAEHNAHLKNLTVKSWP